MPHRRRKHMIGLNFNRFNNVNGIVIGQALLAGYRAAISDMQQVYQPTQFGGFINDFNFFEDPLYPNDHSLNGTPTYSTQCCPWAHKDPPDYYSLGQCMVQNHY